MELVGRNLPLYFYGEPDRRGNLVNLADHL